MKILMTLWLGIGLIGLVSPSAVADPIPAAEAGGHVGEEATVTGRVVRVAKLEQSSNRPTILDLDWPYPDAVFQVVIFEKDLAAFGGDVRADYEGKTVAVTGAISRFRNTPQMVVSQPAQLRLVDGGEVSPAGEERPGAAGEFGSIRSVLSDMEPISASDETGRSEEAGTTDSEAASSAAGGTSGRGARTDRSSLPPNLLENGKFANGKSPWTLDRGTEVEQTDAGAALRIRLSPTGVVRVTQRITSGIPRDARQYQAFFQARLDPGARLDKPLMLRLGERPDFGSELARKVRPGGSWHEVKWTRTSDLKDHAPLIFTIEAGPGEGDLWIRDAYLFAHPDYKDKATWKVSDG